MTLVISGTTTTGVVIQSTTPGANPITVTSSGYVTTGNLDAFIINGPENWTVSNDGRIVGPDLGLLMGNTAPISNGTIDNQLLGTISGDEDGMDLTGTMTVENQGLISGALGVYLNNGGLTNTTTGTITGFGGIDVNIKGDGSVSVVNAGQIIGTIGYGVFLQNGGSLTNLAGGTITAGQSGISVAGNGSVTNAGLITGKDGISLSGNGTVTNQFSGVISGTSYGVVFMNDPGTVTNAGSVSGGSAFGIYLKAGGGVSNQSAGSISGPIGIYSYLGTSATVTNAGVIEGTNRYGVWLRGTGRVINLGTGTIVGTDAGISLSGTVFNEGTLGGGTAAVEFAGGSTDRLILGPGAVFAGTVDGGNVVGAGAVSTLELASATSAGEISGIGSEFTGFAQIAVDIGAQWTLTGANTLVAGTTLTNAGVLTILDTTLSDAGDVINDGVIQEDAATLVVGTLSGTGEMLIGGGSTLSLSGSAAGTVDFAGTGLLTLVPSQFAGQIDGLGGGGRLELIGVTDATAAGVVNGNTLAITQSAGPTFDLTLDPSQSYAGMVFPVTTLGGLQVVATSQQVGPDEISQGQTQTLTGAAATAQAALSGGVGGITVTGASSLLNISTGAFMVGDSGLGDVSIEAGGTVAASTGATIANTASASGSSITVSGVGSELAASGALVVGAAGEGSLSVSQGAIVTGTNIDEASGTGGDGIISVVGTGSALTLTGSLTVGDQAAGEVSILNGATVNALDVTIGDASSLSSGNVDVEGAGSELFVGTGGVLNVGFAGGGSGELTIGPGTTLHSNAGVVESGHASYNNNGGAVDPPFVDITTPANAGLGSNLYDLYVENIDAVQIVSGTGTWDTPMMLTGTSVADAQNNINVNGDTGEWQLSSGGTLIVNANTVDSGQAIVFEDATDTLVIGQIVNNGSAGVSGTAPVVEPGAENLLQAGGFAATIWGYQTGDQIQFANMVVSSASVVNGNTVDLFGSGNVSLGSLAFFTKTGSKASDAGATAAALQIPVQCFAAGTRIETVDGLVAVEDLRVGDRVVTADGGNEPIVWLGQRAVNCARHPRPETVWPVRVQAGAFGENIPVRDLHLSPDHAVFVNGVLVPVKLLINSTSITQVKRSAITYFHVELPRHAVVLADGLSVESYLDTGDRADFCHANGTIRLLPDFAQRLAPAAAWETRGVAPLVTTGEALAAAGFKCAATSTGVPGQARDANVPAAFG